jgi:hypothetical protein
VTTQLQLINIIIIIIIVSADICDEMSESLILTQDSTTYELVNSSTEVNICVSRNICINNTNLISLKDKVGAYEMIFSYSDRI